MIVLDVKGKQFLSYESFGIKLSKRGVVLVLGNNGSGKSVIVTEGLSWCLFGYTVRGLTGDAVIHDPQKTGKGKGCDVTTRVLSEETGHTYEVRRFRKVKSRNGLEVHRINSYGARENLTMGRVKDTQALINNVLGLTWETFLVTTIFGQGQVDKFSGAADATRKEILDSMLGMGTWTDAREVVRIMMRANASQAALAQSASDAKSAVLNHNAAEVSRERVRSGEWLREYADRLRSLQQWLQLSHTTLQEHEVRRVDVDMLRSVRDRLKARKEESKVGLQDAWTNAKDSQDRILEAAERAVANVELQTRRHNAARDVHVAAETAYEKAKQGVASALAAAAAERTKSVDAARTLHNQAVERRQSAGDAHKKAEEAYKQHVRDREDRRLELLDNHTAMLNSAKGRVAGRQEQIDELIIKIEKRQAASASPKCHECDVDLVAAVEHGLVTQSHVDEARSTMADVLKAYESRAAKVLEILEVDRAEVERYEASVEELTKGRGQSIPSLIKICRGARADWLQQDVEQTLHKVTEAAIAATKTEEVLEAAEMESEEVDEGALLQDSLVLAERGKVDTAAAEYAVTKHAKAQAFLKLTEATEQQTEINELLKAARETARDAANKLAVFDSTSAISVELAKVETQIIQSQKGELAFQNAKQKLTEQIAGYEAKLEAHGEQSNPHDLRVKELNEQQAELQEACEQADGHLVDLADELVLMQKLDHAFGPAGVRSHLLDQVVPELNEAAGRYAAALSGGRLRVEFDTETQLASGDLRDNFDMKVSLEPGASSYKACSGGWRKRADLAQLLAFRSVRQSRHSGLDMLVLDEPLTNVDGVGTEQAVALIAELSQNLGTVLICTHDDALQSYFSQRVHVTIDAKGRSDARGDLV